VRETVIELKPGRPMGKVDDKTVQRVIWVMFAVIALGVFAYVRFELPPWMIYVLAMGVPAAVALGLLWAGLRRRGRPSRRIVISPDRVQVRYGEEAELGSAPPAGLRPEVDRARVSSAKVGSRWLTLRDAAGKRVLHVPLRPKRDEILNELRRHGWPVTEGFGGLRRH
jgi:hypothetical protein